MKKQHINLYYTKHDLYSDCKQSTLLQVAVRTIKVSLVLQMQHDSVQNLHDHVLRILNQVFHDGSEQGRSSIKPLLGNDSSQGKPGLYDQLFLIYGVPRDALSHRSSQKIKSQLEELDRRIQVKKVLVEDERSFRISLNQLDQKAKKRESTWSSKWIKKPLVLPKDDKTSDTTKNWPTAYIAIQYSIDAILIM